MAGQLKHGQKNDLYLYLRGPKRIGKSFFCDFMIDHVIGRELAIESDEQALVCNAILLGIGCIR